jgi:hypothetical protein
MRMRHIAICGLSSCTTFFHIISQTVRFSKKKKWLNTKCVFWFSVQICLVHFSFQEELSEMCSQMYIDLPVILVRYWWNLNFLNRFFKNTQSNFMKIRPVGAELFHAERRTDGQTEGQGEDNIRSSPFCERYNSCCPRCRSRWGECLASRSTLYPRGQNRWYPFNRRLGGMAPEPVKKLWRKQKLLVLAGMGS